MNKDKTTKQSILLHQYIRVKYATNRFNISLQITIFLLELGKSNAFTKSNKYAPNRRIYARIQSNKVSLPFLAFTLILN